MKKGVLILALISIILAVLIPYVNSIQNPFIWDEEVIILGNPIIKEWRHLPLLFKTNIFGTQIKPSGYFRPFYMLSFMLDYHLWKLNTIGYHLSSVILHILNALLLYMLLLKLALPRKTAWFSALLFALFPVNCEAVSLIAARVELIFGVLALLCIISFLNGIKGPRIYFLGSALLFVLAILTKESALILPFLILIYVFIFLEGQERQRAIAPLLALMAVVFIYGGTRAFLMGSASHRTLSLINEASFMERIYTVPRILLTHIRLIVFPSVLKSEYHFVVRTSKDIYFWLGIPILISLFVATHKFLKPKKHALFFSCWFLVGLVPYYNIIMPLHATLMEHWVYFPAMGFAALMGMVIFGIADLMRSRLLKYVSAVMLAALMVFYAARIIERNREWGEPFVLYQRDVEREPNSFLLHCNLGVEYFRRGMMDEAKKEFIASIRVSPGNGYDMAYNNLGVIYARQGNIPEAIANYKKSITLDNGPLAYANLGGLYNNLERYEDAMLLLEEGARLYPLDVEIRYQLGVAYYNTGRIEQARHAFKQVQDLHRDYSETRTFLERCTAD